MRQVGAYDLIISKIPSIHEPKVHLNFKTRLKWTALMLLIFLFLGQITIYGVSAAAKDRFLFLDIILGSSFGSLMTLGIGPIVTASIILQLLVGSKIIPWNIKSPEGRKKFQGSQKLLTVAFCFIEAVAYTLFGAIQPISPDPGIMTFIVIQLAFGGMLVLLMDEVISKWGIGSGVSLFIAAGVTRSIFIRAFNPFPAPGDVGGVSSGLIPQFVINIGAGEFFGAIVNILPIIATIIVFFIVVYAQAIKVEIPLAFASVRGFSRRWPLQLLYTNTIPVILIGALLANISLMGTFTARATEDPSIKCGILGCITADGVPTSGPIFYLSPPSSLAIQVFFLIVLATVFVITFLAFYFKFKTSGMRLLLFSVVLGILLGILTAYSTVGLPILDDSLRAITYLLVITAGATIFSIFWVSTSGMDARSVAEQIEGMGMQIPGFRKDPRIVEQVLDRYIPTLAIISGLFIGLLASVADFTGALGTGTGILLTAMIIYSLYEQISQRYLEDMHPAFRKFFG